MVEWLFQTGGDVVPFILRMTLAVVMFPHGAQKALGWFGGYGFKGTLEVFRKSGIPAGLGVLAIMAALLGSLGLAMGLFTRVAALGIGIVMLVAMVTVHRQYGFFMNWYGAQQGEGFEYHVLALGLAIALVFAGAGVWSLDAMIAR